MPHNETALATLQIRSRCSDILIMRMPLFILTVTLLTLTTAARAGVPGLEDARDLAVACDKGAKLDAEDVQGFKEKVCIARGIACDVKSGGELLFHANIDIVCKQEGADCPTLEACAVRRITGALADAVRLKLDPNNASRADGSVNPLEREDRLLRGAKEKVRQ